MAVGEVVAEVVVAVVVAVDVVVAVVVGVVASHSLNDRPPSCSVIARLSKPTDVAQSSPSLINPSTEHRNRCGVRPTANFAIALLSAMTLLVQCPGSRSPRWTKAESAHSKVYTLGGATSPQSFSSAVSASACSEHSSPSRTTTVPSLLNPAHSNFAVSAVVVGVVVGVVVSVVVGVVVRVDVTLVVGVVVGVEVTLVVGDVVTVVVCDDVTVVVCDDVTVVVCDDVTVVVGLDVTVVVGLDVTVVVGVEVVVEDVEFEGGALDCAPFVCLRGEGGRRRGVYDEYRIPFMTITNTRFP